MSHTWMSHVTHKNESCHTHKWVMSHTWMSHVTHNHYKRTRGWSFRSCHAATHCNTLQLSHCNTLQHTATMSLQHTTTSLECEAVVGELAPSHHTTRRLFPFFDVETAILKFEHATFVAQHGGKQPVYVPYDSFIFAIWRVHKHDMTHSHETACLSVCVFMSYVSICLCVHVSVCQCATWLIHMKQPVWVFVCYVFECVHVCVFMCLCVYVLRVYMFVCLYVCVFMCVYVYVFVC